MRIIILPTDFSENAFNALHCAFQYFKYERSRFVIVHAYGYEAANLATDTTGDDWQQHTKRELEASQLQLKQLHQRIQAQEPNPKHAIETVATLGYLVDVVNDLVDKENADLVVMGTRGKSVSRSVALGSNTVQMLKFVKCPVLGVPLSYVYERPSHMLFPSNLMIPFHRRELKLISCLAKSYRSVIHLLYIADYDMLSQRQLEVKAFWESRFRESELKYHRSDQGNHAAIIKAYATQNPIDLLVMVNSNYNYLESLIQTPTVDELGLTLDIPFLILQNKPR